MRYLRLSITMTALLSLLSIGCGKSTEIEVPPLASKKQPVVYPPENQRLADDRFIDIQPVRTKKYSVYRPGEKLPYFSDNFLEWDETVGQTRAGTFRDMLILREDFFGEFSATLIFKGGLEFPSGIRYHAAEWSAVDYPSGLILKGIIILIPTKDVPLGDLPAAPSENSVLLRMGEKLPYFTENFPQWDDGAVFIQENDLWGKVTGTLIFQGRIALANGWVYHAPEFCVVAYPDGRILTGKMIVTKSD